MAFPLDDFLIKVRNEGRSEEFIADTTAYIELLTKKELPVLFSLEHLALEAQVNLERLGAITLSTRSHYYKKFKLKKRNGGFRAIQVPDSDLKYLQKWLLVNILNKIPSHSACKGFDPGNSIKANADCHLNKDAVLKIDLMRFYDSIPERRIFGIFKGFGYHPNLAVTLAKICTVKPDNIFFIAFKKNEIELRDLIKKRDDGILPQGAPTSPKLSNLITRSLDVRLQGLAEKHGLSYSRYADDLTFSGEKDKLLKVKKVIYAIIEKEGFFVNFGKTKLLVRGNKFFVTGLSIHNDSVKVPKKTKKKIEHHLFHCLNSGVNLHMRRARISNRNFKDWLLGLICFVNSIEESLGKSYFEQFQKIEWPI
jgi:RNA-directed DNA polymerase